MDTIEFQEYAKCAVELRFEYGGDYFTINEVASGLGAYERFRGSPLSEGIFLYEKYGVPASSLFLGKEKWDALKADIMKYGVRNSLLVALMPTASTSQILGNTECFEPITSNIYTRRTLAGDFVVLNRNLVDDLLDIGLWSKEMKDKIIAENGSIANISGISAQLKEMYKTVWEIKQKTIIDLCADRAPFICQTQSMNLFFEEPKIGTLGSALIYGWNRGLKTGSYYIRSRPKIQAQQFTIDPKMKEKVFEEDLHVCESCSG
jgi:ribonucleoside-diphosphate reductase alpha chain